jgi:hypothetical protein
MVQALRQTVTIRNAGHLEITSPELRAGAVAEVIVLVEPAPSSDPLAALDELQRSVNLTPQKVEEWISEVRAERTASGPRGLE